MANWRAFIAGLLITAPFSTLAVAVEDYDACIDLIAVDPARAVAEADRWARFDGGWAALHCEALAHIALDAPRQAAIGLSEIARQAGDLPRDVRGDMFAHAGELYLEIGQPVEARAAFDRASQLSPQGYATLILAAGISADARDWRGTINRLNKVLEVHGEGAETLTLRATAKRRLGDLVGARSDALWASELAPDLADVWLELGQVEGALGDRLRARRALLKAITLAGESPLADLARRELQILELAE